VFCQCIKLRPQLGSFLLDFHANYCSCWCRYGPVVKYPQIGLFFSVPAPIFLFLLVGVQVEKRPQIGRFKRGAIFFSWVLGGRGTELKMSLLWTFFSAPLTF